MSKSKVVGALLVSGAVMLGCADYETRPASEDDNVGSAQSSLYTLPSVNLWPSGIVPICWDSTVVNYNQYTTWKHRIVDVLNDHYSRAALLHFEDAGPCSSSASGVIKIVKPSPGGANSFVGYWNYQPTVMNLDFDSGFFGGYPGNTQGTLLHEVAHALGFEHEWLRPDWTLQCDPTGPNVSGGNRWGTAANDLDSILLAGYCNGNSVLSANDLSGLSTAYGTPGKGRYEMAAIDTGGDVLNGGYNNWWSWYELFPDVDNVSSAVEMETLRVGSFVHLRIFSHASGTLLMQHWNGTSWSRTPITGKTISLAPAAIFYRNYGTGPNGSYAESKYKWHAFSASAGNLVSYSSDGTTSAWADHGRPLAGVSVQDVDVVAFRDYAALTHVYAFVVGSDGNFYIYNLDTGSWGGSMAPPNAIGPMGKITYSTFNDCTGAGCTAAKARQFMLWSTSADGRLWALTYFNGGWSWVDHGFAPAGVILSYNKPAVMQWTEDGAFRQAVFVRATNGTLNERRWNGTSWSWVSHGRPPGVAHISTPSATTARHPLLPANNTGDTVTAVTRSVFVISNTQKAWLRWSDDGTTWQWKDLSTNYGSGALSMDRGISALWLYGK